MTNPTTPNLVMSDREKVRPAVHRIVAVIRALDLDLTEVETMDAMIGAVLVRCGQTVGPRLLCQTLRNMADAVEGGR